MNNCIVHKIDKTTKNKHLVLVNVTREKAKEYISQHKDDTYKITYCNTCYGNLVYQQEAWR